MYQKVEFDAKTLAKDMTMYVTIKGYEGWRIRLWLALQLIRLAAWIAWVEIEVNNWVDIINDD